MAKQPMEEEDKLRRRARRRLIGAITLTLIVVIALPMILDSEPKPSAQDVDLHIPDKDKTAEFVPKMSAPVSAPVAIVPSPIAVTPASGVPVAEQAAPVVPPAPEISAPAVVAQASVPAVESTKSDAAKVTDKSVAKVQVPPRSGFVVQIGAFAKAEKAQEWQKKFSKRGFRAYTEEADDKVRVRLGPYATREVAEKLRRKLQSEGLHPNVVELTE